MHGARTSKGNDIGRIRRAVECAVLVSALSFTPLLRSDVPNSISRQSLSESNNFQDIGKDRMAIINSYEFHLRTMRLPSNGDGHRLTPFLGSKPPISFVYWKATPKTNITVEELNKERAELANDSRKELEKNHININSFLKLQFEHTVEFGYQGAGYYEFCVPGKQQLVLEAIHRINSENQFDNYKKLFEGKPKVLRLYFFGGLPFIQNLPVLVLDKQHISMPNQVMENIPDGSIDHPYVIMHPNEEQMDKYKGDAGYFRIGVLETAVPVKSGGMLERYVHAYLLRNVKRKAQNTVQKNTTGNNHDKGITNRWLVGCPLKTLDLGTEAQPYLYEGKWKGPGVYMFRASSDAGAPALKSEGVFKTENNLEKWYNAWVEIKLISPISR